MTAMNIEIDWKFPPLSGGQGEGFNNPGIALYEGDQLNSLAREVIQNAMDARKDPDQPVEISFELREIRDSSSFGQENLLEHIKSCKEEETDPKVIPFVDFAQKLLTQKSVPFLCISDRNTTGLRDEEWKSLVKQQGRSKKRESGAGGSFGIGKFATFASSPLRTVCYWTCYAEQNRLIEKFQGKAVLLSHHFDFDGKTKETQGIGFFGNTDECRELLDSDIPDEFRILDRHQIPIKGTALWIAGFQAPDNWQTDIGLSIVENYFYAICKGNLSVLIEPTSSSPDDMSIDDECLASWFDKLENGDLSEDDRKRLNKTRAFWSMIRSRPHDLSLPHDDFGECKLWIDVAEGLPREVALIRGTGMLITTQQPGLMRFPGFDDFAAVCVVDDPKGNEFLKDMENPNHDKFETDRLSEDRQQLGKSALKSLTTRIRDAIRDRATPDADTTAVELDELAQYLPDLDAPGPLDDEDGATDNELPFGEMGEIMRRPPKKRKKKNFVIDDDGGGEDGETIVDYPDDNGRNGGVNGEETEGSGESGRSRGIRPLNIEDVRITPIDKAANRYKLSFMPTESGTVKITLSEAGDSNTIKRSDITAFTLDDKPASLDNYDVLSNRRESLVITADDLIGDRAWEMVAYRHVEQ